MNINGALLIVSLQCLSTSMSIRSRSVDVKAKAPTTTTNIDTNYKSYSEFMLDGDGRNGTSLALANYQKQLRDSIAEVERMRALLVEKEQQLKNAWAMPKEPPNTYWKWVDSEHTERVVYNPNQMSNHQMHMQPWNEYSMQRVQTPTTLKSSSSPFRMVSLEPPGRDPHPENGVVVQSIHGVLYVPKELINSLMKKLTSNLSEDESDHVMYETHPFVHGKLGYILERLSSIL